MVLIDSNIIIYGSQSGYQYVRDYLEEQEIAVSKISRIEVLGFHSLQEDELDRLIQLFGRCYQYDISDETVEQAIALRQRRKMSLGDAVIAATALQHELLLITANEKDFNWIPELSIYNPVVQQGT